MYTCAHTPRLHYTSSRKWYVQEFCIFWDSPESKAFLNFLLTSAFLLLLPSWKATVPPHISHRDMLKINFKRHKRIPSETIRAWATNETTCDLSKEPGEFFQLPLGLPVSELSACYHAAGKRSSLPPLWQPRLCHRAASADSSLGFAWNSSHRKFTELPMANSHRVSFGLDWALRKHTGRCFQKLLS